LEIRQGFRNLPSRPIALAMAALAVIALALTTWFVFAGAQPRPTGSDRTFVNSAAPERCGVPYSPSDPICSGTVGAYSPHGAK
jgi:hypothetical protein